MFPGFNPWFALEQQQQQNPVMMTGVPYVENPAQMSASVSASQPQIMPDVSYDRLMKRLEQKSLQGIGDQRKSVEKLNKYKDALLSQQNAGLDLSPLMQLADTWTGSNLSQGYKAPESAAQRLNQAMGVEQQIANQNAKITDDELGLLRSQIMGDMYRNKAEVAANKDPKITAEQWKAGGFAARMADADAVIGSLQDVGTSRSSQLQMGKFYPSELMGEDVKKIDQAQRNFINATLRRESGAAISPEEFTNARLQYFPQPGDPPDVLAQKAQNRQRVIQSFALEGGNAYQQIVTQNPIASPVTPKKPGGNKPSFEEWKKSKGY